MCSYNAVGAFKQSLTLLYDSMQLTAFLLAALTATVGVVQAAPTDDEDPCWKVCWEFIPKCPDGMYSNNKGTAAYPCWTCCVAPGDLHSFPLTTQKGHGACN